MNRRRVAATVLIVAVLAAPVVLSEFAVGLMNYIALAALVALGLVLLTGVAGVTSFGQAAFVGIGAYTTAALTTHYGLSPWATLPIALVITALLAAALGWLTLRLGGHFLPLSTMAWGLSLYFLFGNIEVLGGHTGIDKIPPLRVGPLVLDSQRDLYYLIWASLFVAMLLVANLLDSRTGRGIRALKRGSLMLQAFGADVARLRMISFVCAALLAAFSGWLYAHLLRFVNPTPFGLDTSIEYLFMAVIGGAASVFGALAGAGLLVLLKEGLQRGLPYLVGQSMNLEMTVFGILMLLLLHRARSGLTPALVKLLHRRQERARATPIELDLTVSPLDRRVRAVAADRLLDVQGIHKTFGGLVAVDHVSFHMTSGEILGLIGPNGAGKSTTFNLITGVTRMDEGEVYFAGARIDGLGLRDRVQLGIARTFQHVNLIPEMSVLENVALGAYTRGERGVAAAALRLNRFEESRLLAEAARQLDRVGLASRMYERAGDLALGQQRILELARALAADPVLLLLDEPAAGLRFKEKAELAALLKTLRSEGVGILIVEHDMDLVMKLVDRIVVMDAGRTLSTGTPAAIQHDERVREAYLGRP